MGILNIFKKTELIHAVRLTVILTSALFLMFFCSCTDAEDTRPLDEVAVDYVMREGEKDVSEEASKLNGIVSERKASREASAAESRSIEESIAAESRSIAESEAARQSSIEQEEYERYLASSIEASSIEEESLVVSSVQESIYAGGTATGVLTPGKVVSLSESEIPKIRALFSDCIIVGNSRARSILDSGILTENEVIYKWAAHVDDITDVTLQAASLYRSKILFIMGVNDLGYYMENVEAFIRDYEMVIDTYRSVNPNGEIYLQEIIPINEAFRHRWHNMDRVTDYNEAIKRICAEKNCTMVHASAFALPEFLTDDGFGAHYNRQFHIYWAQTVANQMHLFAEGE